MTDDAYDPRLSRALRAYSDGGIRPIDAMAIAEAAMGPVRRPRNSRTALVRLALVAAIVLATIGAALAVVGSRPQTTEPVPSPVMPTSGAVSITGAMGLDRQGHASVLLNDGRVLVLGGASGNTLDSAEIWDPATGSFSATGSMTIFRGRPTATLLDDGRVLALDRDQTSADIFDPTTGRFTTTGSVTPSDSEYGDPARSATLLADGRVFVAPGAWGEPLLGADIYDPAKGTFTQTPPVPCGPVQTVTRLRDGRVLVTCLSPMFVANDPSAFLYDPVANTYSETGAPTSRNSAAAVLLADGRVLIGGIEPTRTSGPASAQASAASDSVDVYDPATGVFTALPIPPAHIVTAVALADGRVLLVGPASMTILDPATGGTQRVPGTNGARTTPTATLLQDGRVLVVGDDGNPGTSMPAIVLDPSLLPGP